LIFVQPVSRATKLGPVMHLPGPNLNFQRLTVGTNDGRMQRLIHVRLWLPYEILEPPRNRFPEFAVYDGEGAIALFDGIDDNA